MHTSTRIRFRSRALSQLGAPLLLLAAMSCGSEGEPALDGDVPDPPVPRRRTTPRPELRDPLQDAGPDSLGEPEADAGGRATPDATPPTDSSLLLFVANSAGDNVLRFDAAQAAGDTAPLGAIGGPNARLDNPSAIQPDGIGGLLVTSAMSHRVVGFLGARQVTGDATPERYVGGVAAGLSLPWGAVYSVARGELFVANAERAPAVVNVYAGVNTPEFTGDVAPARRFYSNAIDAPHDLELTDTDELYVVNSASASVSVFARASTLNGEVAPTRVLRSPDLDGKAPRDAHIDARGRLLIAASDDVVIFDDAAQLDGTVPATRVLEIPGTGVLTGIVADAAGTVYVSDLARNSIYVFDPVTAANANGSVVPERVLTGAYTGLAGPLHLLLLPAEG